MSAERRRIIAIVGALAVFAAAGVFWLTWVVLGGTEADFAAGSLRPSTVVAPTAPQTKDFADSASPATGEEATDTGDIDDPDTSVTETATTGANTTRPGAAATTRRPSPTSTTSRPAPPPPPVPTHAIRVGGATLDNDSPRGWCAIFDNNGLGLPVTVTDVRVSGVLRVEAGECADDGQVAGRPACRDGMVLPSGPGCFAETTTSVKEPGTYHGTVQLGLRARCTTIDVPACDVAVLRKSPPTPDRPAILTWTDRGRAVCYRVAPAGEGPDPLCPE